MLYDNYKFSIPEGKHIRVIIDSDAKNEADDQFAIVHALLTPRFENRGIIGAHFGEKRSKSSMMDSYLEIRKILKIMKMDEELAHKGAEKALADEYTPISSPGAELIIKEALADDPKPLFIICLGPLTDIASAFLINPSIARNITLIWIGGEKYPSGGKEYNLGNDINAANIVFKSDIQVWQVPRNAYQKVIVSLAELEYKVSKCGEIGKYLFEQLAEWNHSVFAGQSGYRTGECWCMGDSPAVGLMLFEHAFDYDWIPAPEFSIDMHYVLKTDNRPIRVYKSIDARFILEDFFSKLALFSGFNK